MPTEIIVALITGWGIHLGSHVTYSKTFYHWDSRSGKQINKPFKI